MNYFKFVLLIRYRNLAKYRGILRIQTSPILADQIVMKWPTRSRELSWYFKVNDLENILLNRQHPKWPPKSRDIGKMAAQISQNIESSDVPCGFHEGGAGECIFGTTWIWAVTTQDIPHETHLNLQSSNISFVPNILLNCTIVLKFCTEHASAVLCAKFQND